tara:strand:+ start:1572 stop:2630 length:1059 start_codon:yes stop_codon:yes gene_type:complete
MNICILVLTNTQKPDGASRIRPVKLISEFKKNHSNLYTYYLREKDKPLRLLIKLLLNKRNIDLCYIEPHTYPLSLIEKIIIKVLKFKGAKIFFFYRDIYWKYQIGKDSMSFTKWYKLYFKQLISLKFICKNMDKIYAPSSSFINILPKQKSNKYSTLPPAGDIQNINYNPDKREGIIYVGGISVEYGLDIMLSTFSEINKIEDIPLLIVCRKEDYKNSVDIINNYKNTSWLKIKNLNSNELEDVYKKAKIAILPKKISKYNQISLSYKIFEYASFGLPLLVSNNLEQAQLIKKNNLGFNLGNNKNQFYETIIKYYNDNSQLSLWSKSCTDFIKNKATWNHRYEKIINDYMEL